MILSVRNSSGDLVSKRYMIKIRFQLFSLVILALICSAFYFYVSFTPKVLRRLQLDPSLLAVPSALFQTPSDVPQKIHELPVYYINLNEQIQRREFIRSHLREQGFRDIHRVTAWTVEDVQRFVQSEVTSFSNVVKPNEKEIACVASHLFAMYLAVHDESNDSPFALIVEDDVALKFQVDWTELLRQAPSDFSILQLTTSNSEAVSRLWTDYLKAVSSSSSDSGSDSSDAQDLTGATNLRGGPKPEPRSLQAQQQWVSRQWDSAFWSTQAYLIDKQRLRQQLDLLFSFSEEDHHLLLHLTNPSPNLFKCQGVFNGRCVLPFRLVADILLYSMFPGTYITRIPLFNGATASEDSSSSSYLPETSTISDEERGKAHEVEFGRIETFIEAVQRHFAHALPSYLSLPLREQQEQ